MEAKMIDGSELFNTLLKDFEAHGASAIGRVRQENPLAFLRLIASLIQQDIRISLDTSDATGEMHH
jgi:hypothetical protein